MGETKKAAGGSVEQLLHGWKRTLQAAVISGVPETIGTEDAARFLKAIEAAESEHARLRTENATLTDEVHKNVVGALRNDLLKERELREAAQAGQPIGPIVGAQRLAELEAENATLTERVAELEKMLQTPSEEEIANVCAYIREVDERKKQEREVAEEDFRATQERLAAARAEVEEAQKLVQEREGFCRFLVRALENAGNLMLANHLRHKHGWLAQPTPEQQQPVEWCVMREDVDPPVAVRGPFPNAEVAGGVRHEMERNCDWALNVRPLRQPTPEPAEET